VIQTSWGRPKFGDSQATSIHQGTQGSRSNKSTQDSSLWWAREMKRKGESRWNQQRVRSTSPHTKSPSNNWRRCDFRSKRWIECSCLRVGQPRISGEGRSEWRERENEGYIKDPPKVGGRWEKWTQNRMNRFWNRLNRFPPRGFQFTGRLNWRLDRLQNRLSRAKIWLNWFSKNLHTTFSDRID
jgi:hypothetical protein